MVLEDKMGKVIMGVDIDGCIYPWHKYAWEWFINKTGKVISFIDFWKYPDGFVANNEGTDIILEMVREPSTYTKHDIEKDVVIALWRMEYLVDNIVYITSRPVGVKNATKEWLIDNKIPYAKNLVFADEYYHNNKNGKESAIAGCGCTYYIEDRPKYLETIPEFVDKLFIVDAVHNRYKEWDGVRVNHISEIPPLLKAINDVRALKILRDRGKNETVR